MLHIGVQDPGTRDHVEEVRNDKRFQENFVARIPCIRRRQCTIRGKLRTCHTIQCTQFGCGRQTVIFATIKSIHVHLKNKDGEHLEAQLETLDNDKKKFVRASLIHITVTTTSQKHCEILKNQDDKQNLCDYIVNSSKCIRASTTGIEKADDGKIYMMRVRS